MINKICKENLNSISVLLKKITNKDYSTPIKHLNNSTIGQHSRHIIEFYFCYLKGIEDNHINFDSRERSMKLESNKTFCIETINSIVEKLSTKTNNQSAIIFEYNYTFEDNQSAEMVSNTLRELLFCLDHSIHHQALIKVALIELGKEKLIDDKFGMAYSTIRNNVYS
ncbi:MAG: hypothetical protein ISR00_03260 [Flavobacteriales bacterium]|nr:hypothetical protein [Flavobacteriales bacterium]MBL6872952.1 hypothetical protein [Flavobacteriales bacterium]